MPCQFGTYIRRGELLVNPFVEFYLDRNYEYKPSELGYGQGTDSVAGTRPRRACSSLASGSPITWPWR